MSDDNRHWTAAFFEYFDRRAAIIELCDGGPRLEAEADAYAETELRADPAVAAALDTVETIDRQLNPTTGTRRPQRASDGFKHG